MSKNGSPRPENHVIVLFGATGDLARRKLLPGLFHLHAAGLLPREYRVIGASPPANALTDWQFRQRAEQACADFGSTKPTDPSWPSFAERLSFGAAEPGNTADLEGYSRALFVMPNLPGAAACLHEEWPVSRKDVATIPNP